MSPRKKIVIAGFLAILAVLILWLLNAPERAPQPYREAKAVPSSSPQTSSSPASGTKPRIWSASPRKDDATYQKEAIGKIEAALGAPIVFYGKIIDQNENPVAGAKVDYGTIDKFFANGSKYHGQSDEDGNFSISGIKGAVLTVGVYKEGYYNIEGKSDAAFAYGLGADTTRKEPPTQENPAVFVLQKRGSSEPLIRVDGGQINVPRTGQPLNIDFMTGRTGSGNLQIETWIGDSSQQRFDWRYRLSVPGGGLVERKGQFDFEAPNNGYQASVEVNMPANAEQWSKRPTKEYFAKLSDGRYARFTIEFYAGDRNFVVFTSYLNPKPGSQNLEFDPAKPAKSP